MNNNNVGIIGQGFVGTATYEGLREHLEVYTYDKFLQEKSNCDSMRHVCEYAKIVFACLPTPMKKDGSCDLSILETQIYTPKSNTDLPVLPSSIPIMNIPSKKIQEDGIMELVEIPAKIIEDDCI